MEKLEEIIKKNGYSTGQHSLEEQEDARALPVKKRHRGPMCRSGPDILADILKAAASVGDGREGITRLRNRSNLSDREFKKYLSILMESGLMRPEPNLGPGDFHRTFRLTGAGYYFLTIYEEIASLLLSKRNEDTQSSNKSDFDSSSVARDQTRPEPIPTW
ncbi:MAG: winged helix-turn-helix domain-containing protein [Nitrososphaerales archaeon]